MDLGLDNKVALVTGASSGIGKATALALAAEGCRVCIVARDPTRLEAAAAEIRATTSAEVIAISGDVADVARMAALLDETRHRLGSIDILVNNAGGPPPGSFLEHDDVRWAETLERNFMSVVRLSRAVAPSMKERRWGRILNVTSTIAKEPTPAMVLSASARAAVSAFTKAISGELAAFNVTANTVCPGGVDTDRVVSLMTQTARREGKPLEEILKRSVAMIPSQRFATAAEIAGLMAFLASEQAAYLTGVSLMADGGLTKGIF
jgi:3-oxoacyl-[acyl-carrier protein] reductase